MTVRAGRRRLATSLAVVAALMLVTAACGGTTSTSSPRLISVAEFEKAVGRSNTVTINVHTPHEGDIPGTDLVVAFDQIPASKELPKDHSTPLAVYCRSGNMSAIAVSTLKALGYTNIVELSGGYNAWVQSGRTLTST